MKEFKFLTKVPMILQLDVLRRLANNEILPCNVVGCPQLSRLYNSLAKANPDYIKLIASNEPNEIVVTFTKEGIKQFKKASKHFK